MCNFVTFDGDLHLLLIASKVPAYGTPRRLNPVKDVRAIQGPIMKIDRLFGATMLEPRLLWLPRVMQEVSDRVG